MCGFSRTALIYLEIDFVFISNLLPKYILGKSLIATRVNKYIYN